MTSLNLILRLGTVLYLGPIVVSVKRDMMSQATYTSYCIYRIEKTMPVDYQNNPITGIAEWKMNMSLHNLLTL